MVASIQTASFNPQVSNDVPLKNKIHYKPNFPQLAPTVKTVTITAGCLILTALSTVSLIALAVLGIGVTGYTAYKVYHYIQSKNPPPLPPKDRWLDPKDKKPQIPPLPIRNEKLAQLSNPADKRPSLPPRDVEVKPPKNNPPDTKELLSSTGNAICIRQSQGRFDDIENFTAPTNPDIDDDEWERMEESDWQQLEDIYRN